MRMMMRTTLSILLSAMLSIVMVGGQLAATGGNAPVAFAAGNGACPRGETRLAGGGCFQTVVAPSKKGIDGVTVLCNTSVDCKNARNADPNAKVVNIGGLGASGVVDAVSQYANHTVIVAGGTAAVAPVIGKDVAKAFGNITVVQIGGDTAAQTGQMLLTAISGTGTFDVKTLASKTGGGAATTGPWAGTGKANQYLSWTAGVAVYSEWQPTLPTLTTTPQPPSCRGYACLSAVHITPPSPTPTPTPPTPTPQPTTTTTYSSTTTTGATTTGACGDWQEHEVSSSPGGTVYSIQAVGRMSWEELQATSRTVVYALTGTRTLSTPTTTTRYETVVTHYPDGTTTSTTTALGATTTYATSTQACSGGDITSTVDSGAHVIRQFSAVSVLVPTGWMSTGAGPDPIDALGQSGDQSHGNGNGDGHIVTDPSQAVKDAEQAVTSAYGGSWKYEDVQVYGTYQTTRTEEQTQYRSERVPVTTVVPGYWHTVTTTVPGYYSTQTVDHPSYTTSQQVWHPGYATSQSVWHPGYSTSQRVYHPGHTGVTYVGGRPHVVYYSGYYSTSSVYHPGYTTTSQAWHPGYTTTEQVWHPATTADVQQWVPPTTTTTYQTEQVPVQVEVQVPVQTTGWHTQQELVWVPPGS